MAIGSVLWLVAFVFGLLVIIDVWQNRATMAQNEKILWTVGALLFGILTAILYYFLVYGKK